MSNPQKPQRTDMAEAVRLAMFASGISLVSYGAWLDYPPAGYFVAGLMLFGCAVVGAYRAGK